MCVCVHVCAYGCMLGAEVDVGHLPILIFLRQALSLNPELTAR